MDNICETRNNYGRVLAQRPIRGKNAADGVRGAGAMVLE